MENKALKPGDIVIFTGLAVAADSIDVMGLIVDDDPGPDGGRDAVAIQFYGDELACWSPVHYYCYELDTLLLQGDIRIIRGE